MERQLVGGSKGRRAIAVAMLLVVGVVGAGLALAQAPARAATAGAAVLTNGDGTADLLPGTPYSRDITFSLRLPGGAACSGDSATQGYRVTSYVVPSTVDPNTVTFTNDGPDTPGGYPLYDSTGTAYVERNTAVSTGVVPASPAFLFGGETVGFTTTELPPGAYNIGIACKLPNTLDKFWNVQINIAAVGTAGDFTYALGGSAGPTTTTTTLSVQPTSPAAFGAPVTLTATVTPTAAVGSVSFLDGTTFLGSGNVTDGQASFTTSTLAAGTHQLSAVFTPTNSAQLTTSTSATVQYTVSEVPAGPVATTTTLATSPGTSAPSGATVTFTATVSPSSVAGKVTFLDGSDELGTVDLLAGTAVLETSELAAGPHSVIATFKPTDTAAATGSSSAPASYTVSAAGVVPAAVSVALEVAKPATSVLKLTATVTPSQAVGVVTFLDGATFIGSANVEAGVASYTTGRLSGGTYQLVASFTPSDASLFATGTSAAVATTVAATAAVTPPSSSSSSGSSSAGSSGSSGSSGGSLPTTGASVLRFVLVGLALFAVGGMALAIGRRRLLSAEASAFTASVRSHAPASTGRLDLPFDPSVTPTGWRLDDEPADAEIVIDASASHQDEDEGDDVPVRGSYDAYQLVDAVVPGAAPGLGPVVDAVVVEAVVVEPASDAAPTRSTALVRIVEAPAPTQPVRRTAVAAGLGAAVGATIASAVVVATNRHPDWPAKVVALAVRARRRLR